MAYSCTGSKAGKSGEREGDVLTEALAIIVAGGAVALPMLPLLPYDSLNEISTILHTFSLMYFSILFT